MKAQTLEQLIDDHPLSALQLFTILTCGLIGLLDGFDTQLIAFVAPAIIREWALQPSNFTPIFVAGGIGSLAGSLPFGSVADKYGRRRCLMIVTTIAALGTMATPFVANREQLLACRVVTSFGLGGVLPVLVALAAEYSPRRLRGVLVTATFCSFPFGAVLEGAVAGAMIEEFGWRLLFWIGGLAPLLLLPVIAFALPESLAWLARHGREAGVARIVGRMGRAGLWDGQLATGAGPASRGAGVMHVARNGRGAVTLLLGTAFFVSLLLSYLLVNWVPTLAVRSGATIRVSALASSVLNLAGIVGGLLIARLGTRQSPHAVVASSYALGALGTIALSVLPGSVGAVFLMALVAGFFCIGGQVTLVALASIFYPVEVRSSGVALVSAFGRVGAISGPLVGGLLIDRDDPARALAWVVAAAALVAAASVWLVHRRVASRIGSAVPLG